MQGVLKMQLMKPMMALFVVAISALLGCGQAGGEKTGSVSGTLTYKNAPLANVVVTFTPEKGRPATGETDAAGKFTLSSFGKNDGAVLGKHKISLTDKPTGIPAMPGTPEAANATAGVDRFPAKYKTAASSGLEFEVKAGSNTWDHDLQD